MDRVKILPKYVYDCKEMKGWKLNRLRLLKIVSWWLVVKFFVVKPKYSFTSIVT